MLIKVAEKYEKQKQLLMEAIIKKKESEMTAFGSGYNRDRRYSEIGFAPGLVVPKVDRRHSDLTAYYYQNQIGTNLAPNFSQVPLFGPPHSAKQQATLSPPTKYETSAPARKSGHHSTLEAPLATGNGGKTTSGSDSSDKVEDLSGDAEATLENDEWCSFLDSQLEELFRQDSEVREGR